VNLEKRFVRAEILRSEISSVFIFLTTCLAEANGKAQVGEFREGGLNFDKKIYPQFILIIFQTLVNKSQPIFSKSNPKRFSTATTLSEINLLKLLKGDSND
jgi:hypothetical protein